MSRHRYAATEGILMRRRKADRVKGKSPAKQATEPPPWRMAASAHRPNLGFPYKVTPRWAPKLGYTAYLARSGVP
eukprot:scaffold290_cov364-Prasinococcus_capsulatus_cf.AAC.2